MKNFDLPFAEFAQLVKPSGAINRFPSLGVGADVFSYSVYMNGPLAETLSSDVKEHEFKDVMVVALTEKLGLDSRSARDNLKVAEIVALRSAWMSAVLESTVDRKEPLSGDVALDWATLSDGLTHPWILTELDNQRALTSKLQPSLDRASAAVGGAVRDVPPRDISVGKVVARDETFTMQRTQDGEVVTHENRRLQDLPEVGDEVMVSYYRGTGQVVKSLENIKVSQPFIFPDSRDLAVTVNDAKGVEQIVLFSSISGFEKFVIAHGAETDLVRQAMDLQASLPKAVAKSRLREPTSQVYIDPNSECLAVDYKENGVEYSAIFGGPHVLAELASEYSLTEEDLLHAYEMALELDLTKSHEPAEAERVALTALKSDLAKLEYGGFQDSGVNGRSYMGKIVAANGMFVAQDVGRRNVAIHDVRNLDKAPAIGDTLTVKFDKGRGVVTDMVKASKDLGR
jgi:hypothetical protein